MRARVLLWLALAIATTVFLWIAIIPEWMIVGFHWNR